MAQHPGEFNLFQEAKTTDTSGTSTVQNVYGGVNSFKMGNHLFDDNLNAFVAVDFSTNLGANLGSDVPIVLGMNHIKQFAWDSRLKKMSMGHLKIT